MERGLPEESSWDLVIMRPMVTQTRILLKTIFIVVIAAIYVSILFSYPSMSDMGVIATNVALVVYATYRSFFSLKYNFSIYQFFYIFSLLFMGLAPLVQYKQSIQTVDGYDIAGSTYILTNLVVLTVFVVIDFIYHYRHKRPAELLAIQMEGSKVLSKKFNIKDTLKLRTLLLALSLSSLVYIVFVNQNDLTGLFYRDIFIDRIEFKDNMTMILAGVLRPLSIFTFIFYYKIGKSKPFKMLLFGIALITCFPLALTRFLIGAYWIPVVITVFNSLSKRRVLGYLYTVGLLILFPIFEVFRALSVYVERGSLSVAFFEKVFEAFSSMTYDSYQSLAFVIQNNFITFGQQLVGVLGLFIPRSLWESKPIGSGFTVSEKYGLGWDNISMNFFGEGYINFGFIGILLFAVALAVTMRYLDRKYWTRAPANGLLFPVVYLIILGIFAYIMRGDMIGSFTSTIGVTLSAVVVYCVIRFSRKVQG